MALSRRLVTAARIFRHPLYLAIAAASSILFFYLFRYLIAANNHGIFLILIPIYTVYLLVITSGILFSISLFAVAHSVAAKKVGSSLGGFEGIIFPSIGGLVASCGCAFPLLESILLFFGVNTFEAVGIVSTINSYQIWILGIMIALNIGMLYYYLGKIPIDARKKSKK